MVVCRTKKFQNHKVRKLKISYVTEKERALKKQLGSFIKAFTYKNFKGSRGLYLLQGLQIEKGKQVSITGMMGRFPGEPL
jgi:hypothetical protein